MEKTCTNSEVKVDLSVRRTPRFKAGADLSGKLNRVSVDLNEELHEDHELLEVKITLETEHCTAIH